MQAIATFAVLLAAPLLGQTRGVTSVLPLTGGILPIAVAPLGTGSPVSLAPTAPGLGSVLPLPEPSALRSAPEPLETAARARTASPSPAPKASAPRPLPRETDGGKPRAEFFFNNHDMSQHYAAELREFVARQDEVLVEDLAPGASLRLFQTVSDGKATPAAALRALRRLQREVKMDRVVLAALHGSGVRVLPEPSHMKSKGSPRRRIDAELIPAASEAVAQAYEAFTYDGDADAAAAQMRRYNKATGQVHNLRDAALLRLLARRLSTSGRRRTGVLFGSYHTWPYIQLRKAGFDVRRGFHPYSAATSDPYTLPLRRQRFKRLYRDGEQETKEQISFVLLYMILNDRYRVSEHPEAQTALYHRLMDRMTMKDLRDLSTHLAVAMNRDTDDPDAQAARAVLKWLSTSGLITPRERALFR